MPVVRHTKKIRRKDLLSYMPPYTDIYPTKTEFEKLKVEVEYLKEKIKSGRVEESEEELFMPKEVFENLPKDIQKTIEGVKICYEHDLADFCFMGIRKALSTAIHVRFRREKREEELYDGRRESKKLSKWIELAKQKGFLSANLARNLTKELKLFGDVSAHDYMIDFHKEEVPSVFKLLRLALDRMYHKR